MKAVRAGDLQQTLGAIRDKVQEMDAEEAGKQVSSFIEGVKARVKADVQQGGLAGLKKNKAVWGLGAMVLCGIIALLVMLGGGSQAAGRRSGNPAGLRVCVDRGNMAYSAVIQPVPPPLRN